MVRAVLLLVFTVGVAAPASSDPIVVTFEDLEGQGLVPGGYGGINWGSQWSYYGWEQFPYTPHSGSVRVYNPTPEPQFSFVSPDARFEGAWFAGSPDEGGGILIQFLLFNDRSLVGTSGLLPVSATPAFLSSGHLGPVDTVAVRSTSLFFWIMDDVTYSTASVPEPSSLLLLGTGLVGAMCLRRWRQRKVQTSHTAR